MGEQPVKKIPKSRYTPKNGGYSPRFDHLAKYIESNLDEINEARKACGLPPLKHPKPRNCLSCDKEFISRDAGHRLCGECSQNRAWLPQIDSHFRG
jgi:hypothetical protein